MGRSLAFFFSSRRLHTRSLCDWSSDVCSSDLRMRARILDFVQTLRARGGVEVSVARSEERRVGKECRTRGSQQHSQIQETAHEVTNRPQIDSCDKKALKFHLNDHRTGQCPSAT